MSRVFPRVTKCTFRKYGPSGSIQRHDAQCVLPINIINEKIYVFLWIWFMLLTVLTAIHVVWTLVVVFARQGCQMAKFDPFLSLDCARVEGVGA